MLTAQLLILQTGYEIPLFSKLEYFNTIVANKAWFWSAIFAMFSLVTISLTRQLICAWISAQTWIRLYEWSVVAHAADLPFLWHQSYPKEEQGAIQLGIRINAGVGRMSLNTMSNCHGVFQLWALPFYKLICNIDKRFEFKVSLLMEWLFKPIVCCKKWLIHAFPKSETQTASPRILTEIAKSIFYDYNHTPVTSFYITVSYNHMKST